MLIDQQRLQDNAYRQEIFTALLQEHQHHIYRFCVRRLGEGEGEEVAQEVFLTAWATLAKFRQDAAPRTWLLGIAKNKCAQALRNRGRREAKTRRATQDIQQQAHAEAPDTPEHQVVTHEHQAVTQAQLVRLPESLAKLPPYDRIVLRWHYLEGRSVADITKLVEESAETVRRHLKRASQHLWEIMADASERQ